MTFARISSITMASHHQHQKDLTVFLSHEDHFHEICNQLRNTQMIWFDDVDFARLSLVATVYDRFHRQPIFNIDGVQTGELPDTHPPVLSAPQNAMEDEVHILLYCNTADDGHGTPYHYEWISSSAPCGAEDEESEEDIDDEENNPAPPLPVLPLRTQLRVIVYVLGRSHRCVFIRMRAYRVYFAKQAMHSYV